MGMLSTVVERVRPVLLLQHVKHVQLLQIKGATRWKQLLITSATATLLTPPPRRSRKQLLRSLARGSRLQRSPVTSPMQEQPQQRTQAQAVADHANQEKRTRLKAARNALRKNAIAPLPSLHFSCLYSHDLYPLLTLEREVLSLNLTDF